MDDIEKIYKRIDELMKSGETNVVSALTTACSEIAGEDNAKFSALVRAVADREERRQKSMN